MSEYIEPYGKELLTASEAAKFLRTKPRHVVSWGHKGWLTTCFSNGKVKYLGSEVAEMHAQTNRPLEEY